MIPVDNAEVNVPGQLTIIIGVEARTAPQRGTDGYENRSRHRRLLKTTRVAPQPLVHPLS